MRLNKNDDNIPLLVCTSGLFRLKVHLLDHLIAHFPRCAIILALDGSIHQHKTEIKVPNRQTSKRCVTCTCKMVLGLNQIQTNVSLDTVCEITNFLNADGMKGTTNKNRQKFCLKIGVVCEILGHAV